MPEAMPSAEGFFWMPHSTKHQPRPPAAPAKCVAATALVDEEIRTDPAVYPAPEVVAKLVEARTVPEEESRERVRAWTRIKTGQ